MCFIPVLFSSVPSQPMEFSSIMFYNEFPFIMLLALLPVFWNRTGGERLMLPAAGVCLCVALSAWLGEQREVQGWTLHRTGRYLPEPELICYCAPLSMCVLPDLHLLTAPIRFTGLQCVWRRRCASFMYVCPCVREWMCLRVSVCVCVFLSL